MFLVRRLDSAIVRSLLVLINSYILSFFAVNVYSNMQGVSCRSRSVKITSVNYVSLIKDVHSMSEYAKSKWTRFENEVWPTFIKRLELFHCIHSSYSMHVMVPCCHWKTRVYLLHLITPLNKKCTHVYFKCHNVCRFFPLKIKKGK